MERLTKKVVRNVDGKKIVLCKHIEKDCNDSCQYELCEWSRKALLRLKQYEDTGLTPEQIREIDRLYAEKCRELVECQKKQQQDWIPVSERLPAEPDICEVTVKTSNGHLYTDSGYFDECKKEWWKHDDSGLLDVIAWRMPLPEPYKEEKHGRN